MLNRPLVLGPGSSRVAPDVRDLDTLAAAYSRNTGNLMFSEAGFTIFENVVRASYRFRPSDIDGRDCIVVTAANWLSQGSDLSVLASRLEQTKLPVFILGLGAQSGLGGAIPKLTEGTLRCIKLISERSKFISARGDFSCEVLESYGIRNAKSTGCPSLLMNGPTKPTLRISDKVDYQSTAIHSTRHRMRPCDGFQSYLYQQAIKHDMDIVLQSELSDIPYAMHTHHSDDNDAHISEKVIEKSYGVRSSDAKEYLARRGMVFWDVPSWIQYLSKKNFCVGTRFHGTIASLLAGTPAMLIVHDSRTREMAVRMNIPHILNSRIDTDKPLDLGKLYDREQFVNFENRFMEYYRRFALFFEENNISLRKEFSLNKV